MSNYETQPQKLSCTISCVKINTRIHIKIWICSGWVFIWGWRDWQQQSTLVGSIPCACSHQQSQPGVDVSMRNLWVGIQKGAVGRGPGSTSPTELDWYHDSPDLAHRLLLLLKPTKFAIIMGIPVGDKACVRGPRASLNLPLNRACIS